MMGEVDGGAMKKESLGPARQAGTPIGALLVAHGIVQSQEIELALADQQRSGRRLGEILVEQDLVSRPLLARVLAEQVGVALEAERGFGSGLRALIERRHLERSGRQAEHADSHTAPSPDRRVGSRRQSGNRRKADRRKRTHPC